MYLENPNNTYIDCGSSLDLLTKGVYTRPYQYNSTAYIDKEDLPIVYTGINQFKYNKIKQNYTSHLGNYIVPLNTQDGICVDIGGNTGQFSLKYANFFKVIHIYEPQEKCYEIIKESINSHTNLILFKEAVYNKSGEHKYLISHNNLDSGSVALDTDKIEVKEWTNNIVDKCITISLEDILNRVGGIIDYIKIDCETSEYNLLYNKDLRNIKYMGIELHWQLGETNFNNLVSHILKYFDNPYNYDLSYPKQNIEVLFVSKYL